MRESNAAERGRQLKDTNKNLESRIEERTKNLILSNDALSQSKVFNKAVLDSLSAHIAVVDKSGTIKAVNGAWEKFSKDNSNNGSDDFDYIGKNYIDACHIDDADQTTKDFPKSRRLLSGEITIFRRISVHSKLKAV